MTIAYYFNTWGSDDTTLPIEEIEDGCSDMEIHSALRDYLALKGISVRKWAIERLTDEQITGHETIEDMLKRGKKLLREQND